MKLNSRITIEKLMDIKQSSDGFEEEIWTEFYTCWAGVKRISGSEFIAAKATNSENIVTFTIRYCKKAIELLKQNSTKIYRIYFKESFYNIVYCNDYNNLHEWIDIKALLIN